ncbi:MAG TPA: AgmX/PglI C-terminal domain-containing protein [Steroidobacteraceae bacterium]|nr:AgmX/PglI C-terminal domain-containing protein [Steroidobacteraceae bacterium]
MDAVTAQDPQALVAELSQTRERIEALARELHAVDAELGALAAEREQHRLLHDACRSLDQLGELGGAGLFWGDDGTALRTGTEQLRRVHKQVEAFQQRIGEIDGRRQGLVAEIEQHESRAFLLEDDVFEAQEEEERRRQEWIVEREIGAAANRPLIMPWATGAEDDRRYRKSLTTSLLICLLLALLVPFVDIPLPAPSEAMVKVPDRVVRMMMEKRPTKPAPRPEAKPVQEERVAEQKERPEAEAKKPVRKPEASPDPAPVDVTKPEKGILAFREKLASLKNAQVSSQLGLNAKLNNADNSSGPPQRSMLTTNAPGTSGGIALGSLSRGLGGSKGNGGGGMAGVQVTRASSAIGGGGGGASAGAGGDRPHASGARPSRTDEEIQIVFDRYKASLYRLYNRELRNDPTLRGQMVLRLTIEPDGSVSMCVLQSSDMNAPGLSAQVVDRVRTINFGAKDVDAITIVYPIDFLPAA